MKAGLIAPIVAITILVVIFSVFFFYNYGASKNLTTNYETKTSQGEATIDLTPRGFKDNKLNVDIIVNTHTIDLSNYDLSKLVRLYYKGKSYSPIEAPNLKGHHVSGVLVFSIDNEPKEFSIIIEGIPNVEERRFEWG